MFSVLDKLCHKYATFNGEIFLWLNRVFANFAYNLLQNAEPWKSEGESI